MIDTHAHLSNVDYPDLNQVIERAHQVGVEKIINVGSSLKSSLEAIELAGKYPNLYATVGIHPTDRKEDEEPEEIILRNIEQLANENQVVAIGEAGLDYSSGEYEVSSMKQKELFIRQIEIAREYNLPLIIHSRDADEDILEILYTQYSIPNTKAIMHCFAGDWDFAQKLLDLGLMISFTGIITYPKTEKILEAVKKVPLEKIMIETDCPFLAPQAYRGKRNEPAYVIEIAKKIAEVKRISLAEVSKATTENARKFFEI